MPDDWKKTFEEFKEVDKAPYTGAKPGTRGKKSIKKFCKRLEHAWRLNPTMSLAEIIGGCFNDIELCEMMPFLRDDQLMKRVEKAWVDD